MGMGERKARAKAFKQHTDKAVVEEVSQAGLFSNKVEESQMALDCVREPKDAPVAERDKVRLVDMRDRIDVFLGVASVGYVLPALVESVRKQLRLEERANRAVFGIVLEVSDLTPMFVVAITSQ